MQPVCGSAVALSNHPNDPADALIANAAAQFTERFGRRPRFAAIAPGRINLIGEHTDYNEGFVLPMAIDRWAAIVADVSNDAAPTIIALDLSREASIDFRSTLAPSPPTTWINHLTGVVHQFKNRGVHVPNMNLLLTSTVPIGAGLASSAAIEVATATLLEAVTNSILDPVEKAKLCQRAEHEFAGTPCGIMDMLVSCAAVEQAAVFIDCRTLQMTPVPLPSEASLVVIDTGVRHDLAAGEYTKRRQECDAAANALGVHSLRDATVQMIHAADLESPLLERALHVVTENMRTALAAAAFRTGDLEQFGDLMFASHQSLKDLLEVSCPELDLIVEASREMRDRGVFGARMTGAGFGGSAIVLCKSACTPEVGQCVAERWAATFGRLPNVFTVMTSGPARSLALH